MQPQLQRRVQRYGWDLAAHDYERLWQAQLGPAQAELLTRIELRVGDRLRVGSPGVECELVQAVEDDGAA